MTSLGHGGHGFGHRAGGCRDLPRQIVSLERQLFEFRLGVLQAFATGDLFRSSLRFHTLDLVLGGGDQSGAFSLRLGDLSLGVALHPARAFLRGRDGLALDGFGLFLGALERFLGEFAILLCELGRL